MLNKDGKLLIETERELLLYWLIQTYHALGREGWEEGVSLEELRDDILDVLANCGCEPNHTVTGQNLKFAEPVSAV